MADSNASGAPRKRVKLSDESRTGRKKVDVGASDGANTIAAQNEGGVSRDQLESMRHHEDAGEKVAMVGCSAHYMLVDHTKSAAGHQGGCGEHHSISTSLEHH